jgi:hypothetical protein
MLRTHQFVMRLMNSRLRAVTVGMYGKALQDLPLWPGYVRGRPCSLDATGRA